MKVFWDHKAHLPCPLAPVSLIEQTSGDQELPPDQPSQASGGHHFGAQFDDQYDEISRVPPNDERVELILWYRLASLAGHQNAANLQPIYSVDARPISVFAAAEQSKSGARFEGSDKALVPISTDSSPYLDPSSNSNLDPNMSSDRDSYSDDSKGSQGGIKLNNSLLQNVINPSAKHFATSSLSQRIRLRIKQPEGKLNGNGIEPDRLIPVANLIIDRAKSEDAGWYKCRVDFSYGRTRYQVIKLEVIGKIGFETIQTYVKTTQTNA